MYGTDVSLSKTTMASPKGKDPTRTARARPNNHPISIFSVRTSDFSLNLIETDTQTPYFTNTILTFIFPFDWGVWSSLLEYLTYVYHFLDKIKVDNVASPKRRHISQASGGKPLSGNHVIPQPSRG